MKFKFFLLIIIFLMLSSCSKTDDRLDGLYVLEILEEFGHAFYAERLNLYQELQFKKNTFKEYSKHYNDQEFNTEYKIKIILTNDNGGLFYSINSFAPDSYFNDPTKRKIYTYTFVSNELLLEYDNKKEIYIRK